MFRYHNRLAAISHLQQKGSLQMNAARVTGLGLG